MIIDFRLRPPFGECRNLLMYQPERNARMCASFGMTPSAAAGKASMEETLREMDQAGIGIGVVPGRIANAELGNIAASTLRVLNERYPGRFIGFAGLDPTDREGAAEIIEREVLHGPCRGVNIEPLCLPSPLYADDAALFPVYRLCSRHGVPVMLMTGGMAGPDVSYSDPVQVDHVAAAFPKLRIVVTHGCWPRSREILQVAFRRPNVWLSPDMYMLAPGQEDYVFAANHFLQDRMLYGSNHPSLPMLEFLERYRRLPFKPGVLDKLLHTNAARLLGLE